MKMNHTSIFKKYRCLLAFLFALGGLAEGQIISSLPECPRFVNFYCRCDATQEAHLMPVHMCVYSSNNRDACHPCPNRMQAYAGCDSCSNNICPVCSPKAFGLRQKFNAGVGSSLPGQVFFTFSDESDGVYYLSSKEVFKVQAKPSEKISKDTAFSPYNVKPGPRRVDDDYMYNVGAGYNPEHPALPQDINPPRGINQYPERQTWRFRRHAVPGLQPSEGLMDKDINPESDVQEVMEDGAMPASDKVVVNHTSSEAGSRKRSVNSTVPESKMERGNNRIETGSRENALNRNNKLAANDKIQSRNSSNDSTVKYPKAFIENEVSSKKVKRHTYPMKIRIVESGHVHFKDVENNENKIEVYNDGVLESQETSGEKRQVPFDLQYDNVDPKSPSGLEKNNEYFENNECFVYKVGFHMHPTSNDSVYHFGCAITDEEMNAISYELTNKSSLSETNVNLSNQERFRAATDLLLCLRDERHKRFTVIREESRIDVSNCSFTFLPDLVLKVVKDKTTVSAKGVSKNISVRSILAENIELEIIGETNYTLNRNPMAEKIHYHVNGSLRLAVNLCEVSEKQVPIISPKIIPLDANVKDKYPYNEPRLQFFIYFIPIPLMKPLKSSQRVDDRTNKGYAFPNTMQRLNQIKSRSFGRSGDARQLVLKHDDVPHNKVLTNYRTEISKIKFYKSSPDSNPKLKTGEYGQEVHKKTKFSVSEKTSKGRESARTVKSKLQTRNFPFVNVLANPFYDVPFYNDWVMVDKIENDSQSVFGRNSYEPNMKHRNPQDNLIDLFFDVDFTDGMKTGVPQNGDNTKTGHSLAILEPDISLRNGTEVDKIPHSNTPFGQERKTKHNFDIDLRNSLKGNTSFGIQADKDKSKLQDHNSIHTSKDSDQKEQNQRLNELEDDASGSKIMSHDIDVSNDNLLSDADFKKLPNELESSDEANLSGLHVTDRTSTDSEARGKYNDIGEGKEQNDHFKGKENNFDEINESENEIEDRTPFMTRRLFQVKNDEDFLVKYFSINNRKDEKIIRQKRSLPHNDWCVISRTLKHGALECTLWTYRKECTLQCHPGWQKNAQDSVYRCNRKENKWKPEIKPCLPSEGTDSLVKSAGKKQEVSQGHSRANDEKKSKTEDYVDEYEDAYSDDALYENYDDYYEEGHHGREGADRNKPQSSEYNSVKDYDKVGPGEKEDYDN